MGQQRVALMDVMRVAKDAGGSSVKAIQTYYSIRNSARDTATTTGAKADIMAAAGDDGRILVKIVELDFVRCCVIYFHSKVFMVQDTRLYSLIYNLTCVKSSVVRGSGPVVRRCSPQSLPESEPQRPLPTPPDSAPIHVHHTPTSLQFRVLYTYMCLHLCILLGV